MSYDSGLYRAHLDAQELSKELLIASHSNEPMYAKKRAIGKLFETANRLGFTVHPIVNPYKDGDEVPCIEAMPTASGGGRT